MGELIAAMSPVKIGLIFLGAACTSLGFGGVLMSHGIKGFSRASYPLTNTYQLQGVAARIAASVIMLFALFVIGCGVVTLVFAYFRMRQLLGF